MNWQFKYANTIPTVLYMSNGLICGYITGICNKGIVTSCITQNLPQSTGILGLLSSILSTNYFATLNAADNSELTLVM